jgi:hypothetical protein
MKEWKSEIARKEFNLAGIFARYEALDTLCYV